MKIALVSALASACVAPTLVAANDASPLVVHVFDSSYAGGVDGTIKVTWINGVNNPLTKIQADLSFKSIDLEAINKADGNCTGPVTEYTWHLHTKWNQPKDYTSWSASYKQCSKDATGNHYDPTKACGPASEYVGTPECANKTPNYFCTPKDSRGCEIGDLSGRLGTFKPDKDDKVKAEWKLWTYPRWQEQQPSWSIVIHAVCGKATPRVACAQSQKMGPQYVKGSKHYGHDHDEADADEENDEDDEDDEDDEHDDGDEQDEGDGDDDEDGETLDDDHLVQKPHTAKRETIVVKIYTDKNN